MRGKDAVKRHSACGLGITPAHAGKSHWYTVYILAAIGSPPHMRGKACPACFHLRNLGITPAHAGKSGSISIACDVVEDHPRTCGEKKSMLEQMGYNTGSPPHMRGKGFLYFAHEMFEGITPAHAGKSPNRILWDNFKQDHPRTCGEKSRTVQKNNGRGGSPPHMRGKVYYYGYNKLYNRITPAHAGKRHRMRFPVNLSRDHPRTCGEKCLHTLLL